MFMIIIFFGYLGTICNDTDKDPAIYDDVTEDHRTNTYSEKGGWSGINCT